MEETANTWTKSAVDLAIKQFPPELLAQDTLPMNENNSDFQTRYIEGIGQLLSLAETIQYARIHSYRRDDDGDL